MPSNGETVHFCNFRRINTQLVAGCWPVDQQSGPIPKTRFPEARSVCSALRGADQEMRLELVNGLLQDLRSRGDKWFWCPKCSNHIIPNELAWGKKREIGQSPSLVKAKEPEGTVEWESTASQDSASCRPTAPGSRQSPTSAPAVGSARGRSQDPPPRLASRHGCRRALPRWKRPYSMKAGGHQLSTGDLQNDDKLLGQICYEHVYISRYN